MQILRSNCFVLSSPVKASARVLCPILDTAEAETKLEFRGDKQDYSSVCKHELQERIKKLV